MMQPYPSQYQPPPQWGPPRYTQQKQNNGIATGGFVTALVGAVLALIPIVGIVSWVISPIGLILSIVGLTAASKLGGTGRGMAIAGIALGAAGLLICSLYAAAFTAAFRQASPTPTYSAPSSAPRSAAGATTSAAVPTVSAAPSLTGPFGQGTYLVGEDIAPGRYRTAGAPQDTIFPFCMASRERADGVAIGFPETTGNGPAFITVQASDGQVEFTGDCTWTPR